MLIKGIKSLGLVAVLVSFHATVQAQGVADSTVADSAAKKSKKTELAPVVVKDRANKGYNAAATRSATKTNTLLRDIPQSITVVTKDLMKDQSMQNMSDVVRYMPGITMAQGEGHRDSPTIRGNNTTAGFYVDGVRDDVQYFRDLYNSERIEALKGASSLIFGRGTGGGVINRVTKQAQWASVRELTVQAGSFGNRRTSLDLGQGLNAKMAVRLNGMYESSSLFRNGVNLDRYGVNPTATFNVGGRTTVKAGYEYFNDHRVVDRGIPSDTVTDRPNANVGISTFFGNTNINRARVLINSGSLVVEHVIPSGLTIRNSTRYADYNKFYQNLVPGTVNDSSQRVSISGYNHGTRRHNFFNQTDLTYDLYTGGVRHTLLFGVEAGRQATEDMRLTAYFNGNTATSTISRPLSDPSVSTQVNFGAIGNTSNNRGSTNVASAYLQNQVALTPWLQALAGVRLERFKLHFNNKLTNQIFERDDRLVSPRAGLIFKPLEEMSFYTSYSISHLPSSGDQFSSLTGTTDDLEPEQFRNYEVGAKWDILSRVSVNGAVYRLVRNHTPIVDPSTGATVQTGEQVTNGYELSSSGSITDSWDVVASFVSQKARITEATSAARAGATVALVPQNAISVWSKYNFFPRLGAGVGLINQSRMYAAVDNTTILPSFTRVDAALYLKLNANAKLQLNMENVGDRKYYPTAQGNNNILPGAPRTLRASFVTGF